MNVSVDGRTESCDAGVPVNWNSAGVLTAPVVADTVMAPVDSGVTVVCAEPFAPVWICAEPSEAIPAVTLNVTAALGTGFPNASFTRTVRAVPKAVPTEALWPDPAVAVIPAAAPPLLVRLKLAVVAAPVEATTVNVPATVLAVAFREASPLAFVVAVLVAALRLAPVLGAVKVTGAPDTGFPY